MGAVRQEDEGRQGLDGEDQIEYGRTECKEETFARPTGRQREDTGRHFNAENQNPHVY